MDIFCTSLEDLVEKSRERDCEFFPMMFAKPCGTPVNSAFSWWAGNDNLILVDGIQAQVKVDVDVDLQSIKQEILDELGIHNNELEEFETVQEVYSQGYSYQLRRKEVSDDEYQRSKTIKCKRTGKTGGSSRTEYRAS